MQKINHGWCAFVGAFICSGFVLAADLPVAVSGVDSGNPAYPALVAFGEGHAVAAARLATPIARKGDPDALFLLALTKEPKLPYEKAPLSSQYQAAAYHHRQAAEAGHPEARLRATLYAAIGSKDPEDREKAAAALSSAGASGDIAAIRILGEGHLRGLDAGKPDVKEALKLWLQAAGKGDATSLFLLAKLHHGDFGFPEEKDDAKALEFFRKAADLGFQDALIPLGSMLLANAATEEEGRGILEKAIAAKKWRACQVLGEFEKSKGKQDVANGYFLKGAEAGQSECMFETGSHLISESREGDGLEWIRKSAEAGNATASLFMALRLLDGPAPDIQSAYTYLLDAAEEGSWQAQYRLALVYLDGRLGRSDPATAVAWLTKAMAKGDSEVRFKLATLHEQGIGTPVNYANAGVLYELTLKNGHTGAAGRMAHLLAEGLGVDRNPPLAWAYATVGASRGDAFSKEVLQKLDLHLSDAEKQKAKEELASLSGKK